MYFLYSAQPIAAKGFNIFSLFLKEFQKKQII